MAGMEALLAPNCMSYQPGVPPLDRESFMQFGQLFLSAFGDSQHDIQDVIAEGDKVVQRGTWSAVHRGDFNGIPATGKRIKIPLVTIDRIVNGKIVEHWGQPDLLGLMQQLGVIPTPQQS